MAVEANYTGADAHWTILTEVRAIGNQMLDIVVETAAGSSGETEELRSNEEAVLEEVYGVIGCKQVTRRKM